VRFANRTRARTWDPMIKSLALTVLFQLLSCKLGRFEVYRFTFEAAN
jgi:hypothetical protein